MTYWTGSLSLISAPLALVDLRGEGGEGGGGGGGRRGRRRRRMRREEEQGEERRGVISLILMPVHTAPQIMI